MEPIANANKLGIDTMIPPWRASGEGFNRPWPPLIKMEAAVKANVEKLLGDNR